MLPKPDTCQGCPLYADGFGFVPDDVQPNADVTVFLQNPGENEEREAKPAIGDTGDVLNDTFLPVAQLTRGQNVSVCNALRCRWVDPATGRKTNKLPKGKVLNDALVFCRQYDPPHSRVSVLAGGVSWSAFSGPPTITDWRGFINPNGPSNASLLGTLHPADLFRNPKMKFPLMQDWAKVPKILNGTWPQPVPPYKQIRIEHDIPDLIAFVEECHRVQPSWVVCDTEFTRDTRYLTVVGLTFPGASQGVQIWTQHLYKGTIKNLLLNLFRSHKVIFQNCLADIPVLERNLGIVFSDYRDIGDTMLSHAVLWSDYAHTLEFLASIYSPYNKMKHLSASNPSLYNWGDVIDTEAVMTALEGEFKRDPLVKEVYTNQSLPLVPILLRRMARGLRVNTPRVEPAHAEYTRILDAARLLACAGTGFPTFNIGSDDQLKAYCYEYKGYPVQKSKDTRRPTTDSDAIAALRVLVGPQPDLEEEERNGLDHDVAMARIAAGADPVLEARVMYAAAEQTLSHYIHPLTGVARIYPEYKIHAQASGRWSITNPPLGQLPDDLRDIICPDEGEAWISYDSDQIELRILAAIARDEPYQKAFDANWDVHTINACDIFELPKPSNLVNPTEDTVWVLATGWLGKSDPRRVFAKRFIYRLNYGGYAGTAGDIPGAKQLGLDKTRLIGASNNYLRAHPSMAAWRARIEHEAKTTGVVRTFTGRRRRLLGSTQSAIREAYNHPLQGGAADVLNLTTIRIAAALPNACLAYTMHDSATWAVPASQAERAQKIMQELIDEPWDIDGNVVSLPASFKKVVYGA